MSRRNDVHRKRRNAKRAKLREFREIARRTKVSSDGVYFVDMTKPPVWRSLSGKTIRGRMFRKQFRGIAYMTTGGHLWVRDNRPVEPNRIYFTTK